MKIKEIFADSISFPFSNIKRFLILGVILLFSPLILPTILAQGYTIRIIRSTSQSHREMPEFKNWIDMFIDGLKYFVVNLIYSIPGGILIYLAIMISIFESMREMIVTNGTMNQTMMSGSYFSTDYFSLLQGTLPLTLMAIGIILLALSYMVQLLAIPRMVYKNKVGAAFEIKEIYKEIQLLGWKKYLICGLFLVVITLLSMGASMFLPGILSKYGTVGYLIVLIIIPLIFDSFFYNFQGRFMGLIYPGEVENEDGIEKSAERNPRFVQEDEN
jgi:hypothetical protein